jgi:hypothetical protein
MRNPRFTLRQVAIAIAAIGVLLAFLVQERTPLESLVGDSIPVAIGFMIASLVRHEVERTSGCSLRNPRILLTLMLVGIGYASLAVTILVRNFLARDAHELQLIVAISIPTSLGFVIYQVSQGSLRFRLTIEILTIVALLALSARIWRPMELIGAAERADALAEQISAWAEGSNIPKKRDVLRRESKWFRRRALSLRCQAYWYGLIRGPTDSSYYDTVRLVRELGSLEVMHAHEMRACQEHEGQ